MTRLSFIGTKDILLSINGITLTPRGVAFVNNITIEQALKILDKDNGAT